MLQSGFPPGGLWVLIEQQGSAPAGREREGLGLKRRDWDQKGGTENKRETLEPKGSPWE